MRVTETVSALLGEARLRDRDRQSLASTDRCVDSIEREEADDDDEGEVY